MKSWVTHIFVVWDAILSAGNKTHVMIKTEHVYLRHRFVDFSLRRSVERKPGTSLHLSWGVIVKKSVEALHC